MSWMAKPGARLGRWRLVRRLGQGTFGSAWQAVNDSGEESALKLLKFEQGDEARVLARLCHPAIPAIIDAQGSPQPFVAMELARGRPLSRLIRAAVPEEEQVVQVVAILADAIANVHHLGLKHGDVKPDNIVVGSVRDGRVWLVDFGLAGSDDGGTLQYAAPERFGGGPSTAASDVYSLGLVTWELLHGSLPWAELDLAQLLLLRRRETPRPDRGSPWLRALLTRMLAVDTEHRPRAADVADELAAHGATLPQIDPALLRRRASTIQILTTATRDAIDAWLAQGGLLATVGPKGSGRSPSWRPSPPSCGPAACPGCG